MKRTILAVITLLTVFGLGMLTGVPGGIPLVRLRL